MPCAGSLKTGNCIYANCVVRGRTGDCYDSQSWLEDNARVSVTYRHESIAPCSMHFSWNLLPPLLINMHVNWYIESYVTVNSGITVSGRDKMAFILQTRFSNAVSWKKMSEFRLKNFTDVCFRGSNWQWASISSADGLAPTRRQAIIWTIDG